MRRTALLATLSCLGLTGCLEPVDLSGGRADGSLPSGSDGSLFLADAGGCATAADCPAPLQPDPVCSPMRAVCSAGVCGTERVPRVWDGDPGACESASDCGCQDLVPVDGCPGAYQCQGGRCAWACSTCTSDLQCPLGQVCQELRCGAGKQCTAGCRDGAGCPEGTLCGDHVIPECGEGFGLCVAPPACTSDSDCPAGSVCDFLWDGTGTRACQAGCHEAWQCGAGEECTDFYCANCPDCPCFGRCLSTIACASDADCAEGEVCDAGYDCQVRCVAGCRDDSQCRPNQWCPERPPCEGCGCEVRICEPRAAGCTEDSDCDSGEICNFDDSFGCSGTRSCMAGCLEDADCPYDGLCMLADCGPCCPGTCMWPVGECGSDADCPAGQVCEYGTGCAGAKSCVDGCRAGSKSCLDGAACLPTACLTCPCPDTCAPPACRAGLSPCESTLDCAWGSTTCVDGCCEICPLYESTLCDEGECAYPSGVDLGGCSTGGLCATCCACPALDAPVCGANYQTYVNACAAGCAGVEVLHDGTCEPFEGMGCSDATCPAGQYCRDACPMCDAAVFRCTRLGACQWDFDCPAGAPPPSCAGPQYTCEASHTCSSTCP